MTSTFCQQCGNPIQSKDGIHFDEHSLSKDEPQTCMGSGLRLDGKDFYNAYLRKAPDPKASEWAERRGRELLKELAALRAGGEQGEKLLEPLLCSVLSAALAEGASDSFYFQPTHEWSEFAQDMTLQSVAQRLKVKMPLGPLSEENVKLLVTAWASELNPRSVDWTVMRLDAHTPADRLKLFGAVEGIFCPVCGSRRCEASETKKLYCPCQQSRD